MQLYREILQGGITLDRLLPRRNERMIRKMKREIKGWKKTGFFLEGSGINMSLLSFSHLAANEPQRLQVCRVSSLSMLSVCVQPHTAGVELDTFHIER